MRICFIITRGDAIGGATVHVRDLARGLQQMGHQVFVLVGGTGEALAEFFHAGVPFRSLRWLGRSIHPVNDFLALFELKRTLAELRPDVVCTHTAKAGFLGRLAAAWIRIPAIYTPHGWSIESRISARNAWIFRLAERAVAPLSASIINVCEAEREVALRHRIAPNAKLAVIPNGVHDVGPPLYAQPERSPVRLVMVARFEPQKDHATLLYALALITDLPWTLKFVGDGPTSVKMRALATSLGLKDRVIFSGTTSNVALRLAESQIFVLSSHFEAFPLSILEAMRAGLPTVASDVGGVREAVVEGETGFVVKPNNPADMARALRMLIQEPALRARLGSHSRRSYELRFTFERMLRQTLSLYASVLSGRSGKFAADRKQESVQDTVSIR